ncbi:hypothetical protein ACO0K9_01055 [Undibacterium sp. Ji50W]|uniref:hypothetical protein n=1 Tax=Undibacterium sp. Ji50W TaxID=3413041 RepID=UPI003BEF6E32
MQPASKKVIQLHNRRNRDQDQLVSKTDPLTKADDAHTLTAADLDIIDWIAITLCIATVLGVLCWAGYDQMNDEIKSAEVVSNAIYIAQLDAAEQRKEAMAQALASRDQVRGAK